MALEFYNNYYLRSDQESIGSYFVEQDEPSQAQKHNAEQVFAYLNAQGWTPLAISGVLGNMQHESSINPAAIQYRSSLPNQAANLSDVPNSVMMNYLHGMGLIQWDTRDNQGIHRLPAFAERYNMNWYDGNCQTFRLQRELETDSQYHYWTERSIDGHVWTFAEYVSTASGQTPSQMAHIFATCRVKPETQVYIRENAEYWYNYFENYMPLPVRLIILTQRQRKTKKPLLIKKEVGANVIKF